jgi:hypothetical protein
MMIAGPNRFSAGPSTIFRTYCAIIQPTCSLLSDIRIFGGTVYLGDPSHFLHAEWVSQKLLPIHEPNLFGPTAKGVSVSMP